jgi:hypothetical protein
MTFDTLGYEVVRGAVHRQTLDLLAVQFEMSKECEFYQSGKNLEEMLGDSQVERSYAKYSALCFESLLVILRDQVAAVTKKNLVPAYSYSRIYYKGSSLARHHDRPSCQYSATVAIKNDVHPWDIYIQDLNGDERPIALDEGDMLIYRGDVLDHWRNEFKEEKQIQTFIHYVDLDGEYKDFIYDKRAMLGL